MCEMTDYLRGRKRLVKDVASFHEGVMRDHKEAIRIVDLEDYARSMVGQAKALERLDGSIAEAILRGDPVDRASTSRVWRELARSIRSRLAEIADRLLRESERGYDVAGVSDRVRRAEEYLASALAPRDEIAEGVRAIAAEARERHNMGLSEGMPDPDDWQ